MQVWITGFAEGDGYRSFLVDLATLATVSYDLPVSEFEWSPDSKFALLQTYSDADANGISHTYRLSVASKKVEPVDWDFQTSWRPTDHILADLMEDGQVLTLFNVKDGSIQGWRLPISCRGLVWSPNGERIALIDKDGSLWQVDYPRFEHPEQLTGPLADRRKISWSPDGQSIIIVSGPDIYVIDTMK
jgi:WD40 repeat protein